MFRTETRSPFHDPDKIRGSRGNLSTRSRGEEGGFLTSRRLPSLARYILCDQGRIRCDDELM